MGKGMMQVALYKMLGEREKSGDRKNIFARSAQATVPPAFKPRCRLIDLSIEISIQMTVNKENAM